MKMKNHKAIFKSQLIKIVIMEEKYGMQKNNYNQF